jgi:hypothetical protein
MKRFLALYFHHVDEHNIKKEHMYIYAKDISEALSKWSAISSKNDQLVHLTPYLTVDEQWKEYEARKASQ